MPLDFDNAGDDFMMIPEADGMSNSAFSAVLGRWRFGCSRCKAPAQTPASPPVADGPGVVVEPGATVAERPPVVFPGVTVNGSVTVKSTVGASGEVVDARVVRAPEHSGGRRC
jgi:hypothetical protein